MNSEKSSKNSVQIDKRDYPFELMGWFNDQGMQGMNRCYETPHGILHLYWQKMRWEYEWLEVVPCPMAAATTRP